MTYDEIIEQLEVTKSKIKEIARAFKESRCLDYEKTR